MKGRGVQAALLAVANLVGLIAFAWPFLLPAVAGATGGGDGAGRGGDWRWVLLVLMVLLGGVLFVQLGRGGLGPKTIALIAVLGGAMVALRLPGYILGFSAVFIVPLVAGNAFGPGFGFTLGAVGMFASGLFIGGLGPWLPFQMIAMGWVGAGAGLLPRGGRWPVRLGVLAAYGVVAGFLYGALTNLQTWPFLAYGSGISWVPTDSPGQNLDHYVQYYLVTSSYWDTFRAVGNVILVLALGRPLLGSLDRAARTMHLELRPPTTA